jgi:hypothetical protein
MRNAYPASSNQKSYSKTLSVQDDEDVGWDAEVDGDLMSLMEENARLRALVVQLSDIVLRRVVNQK